MKNDCIVETKDVFVAKIAYEQKRVDLLPQDVDLKGKDNFIYDIIILDPTGSYFYDVNRNEMLDANAFVTEKNNTQFVCYGDFNSKGNKEIKGKIPSVWNKLIKDIDNRSSGQQTTLSTLISLQDELNSSINNDKIENINSLLNLFEIPSKSAREVLFNM